jgi:hypothetical protein
MSPVFAFAILLAIVCSLFFWLEPKETKVQGCTYFTKIMLHSAEGAQTRFAQTVAPSSRSIPHNFFTQNP